MVSSAQNNYFQFAHCILLKSGGDDTSNSFLATRLGSSKNLPISCSKFSVMKIKTRDTNSRFKMKLTQTVGEYVGMPPARLATICKDLSSIGDTVELEMSVSNEVVKFSAIAESGTAQITCRHIPVDKMQPEEATITDMEEPVSLTISLSSMTSLVAAIPSTSQVIINLSSNSHLPVVIE